MNNYCVIDVGGTNIKYALMNENEIFEKGEIPTPYEGLETFVEQIGLIYDRYQGSIVGMAISAPGRIDSKTGFMFTGGTLSYIHQTPILELLKKRCPIHISIENDGKCAALAELWKGSLKGIDNGIVLTLGTGIGGGIVVDGKLIRGQNFAAGEVSLLPTQLISFDPFKDIWAYLNGTNVLNTHYALAKKLDPKTINGRLFFAAVDQKDLDALEILDNFCINFANGLFSLQAVLDTKRVAIGGGISAQDSLINTIQLKVDELFEKVKGRYPQQKMEIVRCTFSNDSNLYGALFHHLYE